MSVLPQTDEDDVDIVPVPMSARARALLVRHATVAGKPPAECAGALLEDLLLEDALYNEPDPPRRKDYH